MRSPKHTVNRSSGRGIFIFERESVVMRKWQILEFDGKPYYAFVPEDVTPIKEETIPELPDDVAFVVDEQLNDEIEMKEEDGANQSEEEQALKEERSAEIEEEEEEDNASVGEQSVSEGYIQMIEDDSQSSELKPVIINGKIQTQIEEEQEIKPTLEVKNPIGDLYQVKVEAGVVMLEMLNVEALKASEMLTETIAVPTGSTTSSNHKDEESNDFENFEDIVEDIEEEDDEENPEELEAEVAVDVAEVDEIEIDKQDVGGAVALKCKACSETFETTLAFRKHVAWTHKKKVCIQENGAYICSVCDYRTLKKALFAAHLQRKHETWSRKRQSSTALFPCAACGFVCRSKHSLQSHFIRKHTDRYEHQCKFCPKKFKVKGDLTNHVRFHHKEKPINCDVCGKLCLNSGSLYVHQKWAHYKPQYECHICKRRMVTQENLDQHMLMQHEKREKIVCAECGKTFTKKDSFKRHMAVHTGSKPYNCIICNKLFARRSQLRQHLLIHTGKRPFVCDICGKAFTQKPGLICHRKTHPGTHPPLPVMPIGDIVKEFTEGYLAGNKVGNKNAEGAEEEDQDDPDEEEEEYELEQEEIAEEEDENEK